MPRTDRPGGTPPNFFSPAPLKPPSAGDFMDREARSRTGPKCHYQGAARIALAMATGVALWLSMYLFTRIMHEKRIR